MPAAMAWVRVREALVWSPEVLMRAVIALCCGIALVGCGPQLELTDTSWDVLTTGKRELGSGLVSIDEFVRAIDEPR